MFISNLSSWFARFIFGTLRLVCVIAFLAWPTVLALKAIRAEQSNSFLYAAFAYVWPFFVCAVVLYILKKMKFSSKPAPPTFSNAADDLLYGSNQPIYSPQSLVNSEIPYTNEHLAKYGSFD